MKKIGFFLTILLVILNSSCEKGAFIPAYNPDSSLEEQLADLYKNGQLPGFAVAIVSKDKILFEKSFGFADIASQTAYTNSTQQSIASLSKTFIGLALMKAIEMGELNLDTPINTLLPFSVNHPDYPNRPITIRHLATHTSGINDNEIGHLSKISKSR